MKPRLIDFHPDDDASAGGGEPAGWTPPENWPEQFKTPDDLLKSYEGLRPETDRLRSQLDSERSQREAERAQFASALEAIEQRSAAAPPGNGASSPFAPYLSSYERAYLEGDAAAML